jgi:hypothetical protein
MEFDETFFMQIDTAFGAHFLGIRAAQTTSILFDGRSNDVISNI